jgi:pilus assembly protein CpaF
LSAVERQQILTTILNDCLGFGPLEPILADSEVIEVLVDGPEKIYVERRGKLADAPDRFRDESHLMSIIHRIVIRTGRQINESHPMVDARFPDGSRVNIVIPPISLIGPVMTIANSSSKSSRSKVYSTSVLLARTLPLSCAPACRAG